MFVKKWLNVSNQDQMSDENNIELRSEEVQEILGAPPRWIIRWGITIILIVVMVLLIGSYFYKYPDLIKARITVLSENPPVSVVAKATGKLDHLFVTDQQTVAAGQLLGVIENPARYEDVYSLWKQLDSVGHYFNSPAQFVAFRFSQDYQLGQIHPYYASFASQTETYITFLKYNTYEQRVQSLRKQVADQQRYLYQQTNQARILDDKLQLSRRQLARDSGLFRKKAISEIDLEKSNAEFLGHELNHRTAIANLSNTQMQINQLQQQVSEQQVQRAEQENKLLSALKEKYENLVNQLSAWEQTFVLKTPIAGKVTFTNIWSANQYVTAGDAVFSVVPDAEQRIIGRIVMPLAGSGKVETGQRVNIKLDNYPHLEYGMLEGRIVSMSLVPVTSAEGGYYTAEVDLQNGLTTNYHINLAFSQEMQGSAEIITKDRRLIERLVEPLVSVFRERLLPH